jgi:hypothetical protein
MSDKGSAFLKGGCGCLALFVLLAMFAVLAGGHAHANIGGLVVLFIIGGVGGLVVMAIYNWGRRDGTAADDPDRTGTASQSTECSTCGAAIPADSQVCPQCGRGNTKS